MSFECPNNGAHRLGLPHLVEVFPPDCSTYVDNLDFHSSEATAILPALEHSQQWLSIWGLSIDAKKTFHWSTDPMERARLQAQGKACLTDVKELGGAMTFCRAIRNRELKHRATALHSKWEILHRSRAPLLHKLPCLGLLAHCAPRRSRLHYSNRPFSRPSQAGGQSPQAEWCRIQCYLEADLV